MAFPINLAEYKQIVLDLNQSKLTDEQKKQLTKNISIVRDSIIFLTALANAKGLGGHTGGPYDIVPEVLICDALMKKKENNILPILFDEAGHRVAIQYVMAVLNNHMKPEMLLKYREHAAGLYGHPERNDKEGIFFSSGRLGHLWSYVNGIAQANPEKKVIMFGSDGSQQEGSDAEAARYAVAKSLNVKIIIDDNDVTIAGHPSEYLKGYSVKKTLEGHGLETREVNPENLDELFSAVKTMISKQGTSALICKRKMAVCINGLEGSCKAHDVIAVDIAISYLQEKGHLSAIEMLKSAKQNKESYEYLGSTKETFKNRSEFGKIVCDILKDIPDRKNKVLVVDSDLEGSCGLDCIKKSFPEVYSSGGIMERNNFSVASGFGSEKGKQGIFGTFSAFLEMVVSEITMARMNDANVIAHFSHAGVDDMADNTCHFGINNFFADNALEENDKSSHKTMLYFPADVNQLKKLLKKVFNDNGLRFIFSTRSATPKILDENGKDFYNDNYVFTPGKDDVIRQGKDVYIISFGEMLYRSLDAVERLKKEGIVVGLINKSTLNVVDEQIMKKLSSAKAVIVVESFNKKTGLGIRFGTWLVEHNFKGKYAHLGTTKQGKGGLWEQMHYQGLDSKSIAEYVKKML